jgi:hypothetical protein
MKEDFGSVKKLPIFCQGFESFQLAVVNFLGFECKNEQ